MCTMTIVTAAIVAGVINGTVAYTGLKLTVA